MSSTSSTASGRELMLKTRVILKDCRTGEGGEEGMSALPRVHLQQRCIYYNNGIVVVGE